MKNGLYSVHIEMLDGVNEPASGIVILRDGAMYGGGPFLFYTGSYSFNEGHAKGEFILNQHTPYRPGSHHFFHGEDIGVGVSGTYGDDKAELFGTALIGNRSFGIRAVMRKLADA
jgi:hypothetical protein